MQKSYRKSGDCSLKYLWIIALFVLFWNHQAVAQLQDFELTIVATDETCAGNATLSFSADNTAPDAVILYTVYLLPDLSLPISASTSPFLGSLNAGTYKVVAIETLGTFSNSVEKEIVINSNVTPLQYEISSISHNCNVGGQIVITPTSGTAVQYEIISGPQIMPLQDNNVFMGMPPGTYNIRVYDECGQGIVTTYTLELNPATAVVSPPIFNNVLNGDCNSVVISNTVQYPEGTGITYPLTVQYTIYPPGGGTPQVSTQVFESGMTSFIEFSHTFPVVLNGGYTYDILITNGCGLTYGSTGMTVNPAPILALQAVPIPCGRNYLTASVSQFMPPFNMQFLEVPDGFSPSAFNNAYPGPFTDGTVAFGDDNNPVPEGVYTVKVEDACGRTAQVTFEVQDMIPQPSAVGSNNGCYANLGRITVSVPDRQIVSAAMLSAPGSYPVPLPQDISSFINSQGILVVNNLPLGTYTLKIIDNCGHEHVVEVTVPAFVPADFIANALSDCTPGTGAVKIVSGNGKLTQISLVEAPDAYYEEVPQDMSAFIDEQGKFYMDNLPAGTYVFSGTDICGIQRSVSVTITGFQPTSGGTSYTYEPHCNSWDIAMSDPATGGTVTYWLQKENPLVPGHWIHPGTGAPYDDGTMPNDLNAYELPNNQTTVNLQFFGNFRIIKVFETVGNGISWKLCLTQLGTFTYQYGVVIGGVYNASCLGNTDAVYIDASGLAPLTYRIIQKDGEPFTLDNGPSNIFEGLSAGVYIFEVENACGQTGIATRNINLLPNLVEATYPDGELKCIGPEESEVQVFDLTTQTIQILGGQSGDVYTVSYYTNETDAYAGQNAIIAPEAYTNTAPSQTIYARVVHNSITICHEVVNFIIQVSEKPVLNMAQNVTLCDNAGFVTLTAPAGFDSYVWSTGQTTSSVVVTEPGEYSVVVRKNYGALGFCETPADITVVSSGMAQSVSFTLVDWTESDNSITVNLEGQGLYEYSIDGSNYQDSNVFNGLETGLYTVYIRDLSGCGEISKEVALLNYPKFFTPNHDGANDTWRIENAWFEPDMMLFIYDRYGKLLTSFNGQSTGWDGTLNGHDLPSTDYWFVAQRSDGRIFKGHFSMIR